MSAEPIDTIASQLERYLHKHIPISSAMGVEVRMVSATSVRLGAPLEPNINHRSTVFGGSAAAVAILAGWALLHVRLGHLGHGSRIVIQSCSIDYQLPIDGDFDAVAFAPSDAAWDRFSSMLERRGRSRVELTIELELNGRRAGTSTGVYVVLPGGSETISPSPG